MFNLYIPTILLLSLFVTLHLLFWSFNYAFRSYFAKATDDSLMLQ